MADFLKLVCGTVLKLLIIIVTALICWSVDPSYAREYRFVVIFIICGLTFLYALLSMIGYAVTVTTSENQTSCCTLTELIMTCAGMILWLLLTGLAVNTAIRIRGSDTAQEFALMAALSALNILLFIALFVLAALGTAQHYMTTKNVPPPPQKV